MATKYLNTETVEFGGEQISIMYYMEDGLYTFKISHVILEPNGNINKPGGGTSMDTTLDGLKFKIFVESVLVTDHWTIFSFFVKPTKICFFYVKMILYKKS